MQLNAIVQLKHYLGKKELQVNIKFYIFKFQLLYFSMAF